MKTLFACMASVAMSLAHADKCSMSSLTEPQMRLAAYYHSQAATSFNVSCSRAYTIRFNSMNLRSREGDSYVSNGPYKVATRMIINGPVNNMWNVPLSANASGKSKYIISVHLEEQPSTRIPAGIYRDVISVNLSF